MRVGTRKRAGLEITKLLQKHNKNNKRNNTNSTSCDYCGIANISRNNNKLSI